MQAIFFILLSDCLYRTACRFFVFHSLFKEQVLYQYFRSDNDEDNAAPQFGTQLAGDAASAPDAEHQSCQ